MTINGIQIDGIKMADAVAAAYTAMLANPSYEPEQGEIVSLTQAYLRSYIEVMEYTPEFLEALAQTP